MRLRRLRPRPARPAGGQRLFPAPSVAALLALCLATLLALLAAAGAGCARQQGRARLVVVGSTSIQPYMELLAEELSREGTLVVDVQGGGSSAGIQAVRAGAAALGMSSRALAPEEGDLEAVPMARDALAVVVHPSNPVGDLSLEQLQALFGGRTRNWREVGGPDRPVTVIIREEGSGTRSAFDALVLQGERDSPRALVQDSNGSVRETVAQDPAAAGYLSYGLADERVKPIRVAGVAPGPESVASGAYPLSRSFLLVYRPPLCAEARAFLDFVLGPRGQALLQSEGLVPVAPRGEGGGR